MRYEVIRLGTEWTVYDNEKDHYIVADDGFLLESAAHIIVWALNAVAEGDNLYRGPLHWASLYDGPTEGVSRG